MIFRNDVWLSPPIEPIITEKIIIKVMICWLKVRYERITNGASFCHVIRTKQLNHDKPSITDGNHIWKGGAPILINNVDAMIEFNISLLIKVIIKLEIVKVKSIEEAIAWTIKYLIDASVDIILSLDDISGINASKLISNPIHVAGHELDLIEIKVPRINTIINKNLAGFSIKIKKKRIVPL